MLGKIIESLLILLILTCLSLILYPILMNKIYSKEIKETELLIKSKYGNEVLVYCQVQNIFEIKAIKMKINCEVQDWKKNPVKSMFLSCDTEKKCKI